MVDDPKVPRYLYKYRSLAGEAKQWARDLIVNQNLYLASPAQMNDPFDCKPFWDEDATPEELKQAVCRMIANQAPNAAKNQQREMERQFLADQQKALAAYRLAHEKMMNDLGIFSLSANPLNLLMWPHYADNHRGVCVQFDIVLLWNLRLNDQPFILRIVCYSPDRPSVKVVRDRITIEALKDMALTKGEPWEYEQEWRLMANGMAGQIVHVPAINGVILGANISTEDAAEVRGWVAQCGRPMQVYQARVHARRYELVTEPALPT